MPHVGLDQRRPVDVDLAVDNLEALTRQGDDALDIEDVGPGEADADDVAARRRPERKREAIDQVQRAGLVGGLHADAVGAHRDQDPAKGHETREREDGDPDGGSSRIRSEHESADSAHTQVPLGSSE